MAVTMKVNDPAVDVSRVPDWLALQVAMPAVASSHANAMDTSSPWLYALACGCTMAITGGVASRLISNAAVTSPPPLLAKHVNTRDSTSVVCVTLAHGTSK